MQCSLAQQQIGVGVHQVHLSELCVPEHRSICCLIQLGYMSSTRMHALRPEMAPAMCQCHLTPYNKQTVAATRHQLACLCAAEHSHFI